MGKIAAHHGLHGQVSELFELDPQEELLPSSPVEILSGLLSELCRLHWCRWDWAVLGCIVMYCLLSTRVSTG